MIHYHGTPISGTKQDAARFLPGRHALVPYPCKDQISIVAEVCKTFVLDNGAFSVWKKGGKLDVYGYMYWVYQWFKHPGFQWALIPDVIQGCEEENDDLIDLWLSTGLKKYGVPVWHMHESLDRLEKLANEWSTIAIGSSGEWPTPGTQGWWKRIAISMDVLCDNHGRPTCKIHGLRMMNPKIFTRLPFASVDSTNAGVNAGSLSRFGMYKPPTAAQRAEVIAERIEVHNSAPVWRNHLESK